ncbi:MAG: hypothetical protein GY854_09555 [Deltaproteobacteria bacterium]|nr:hypothetical protein [Deltaproteobacteria bacterium]
MKTVLDDEYIQIRVDEAKSSIEAEWKGFASEQDYKDRLDKVYEFTCQHRCTKQLTDMRNMKTIPDKANDWIQSNWFPKMVKQGIKKFALVNSKSVVAKLSVERADKGITDKTDKTGISTQFFDDLDSARGWLG